MTNPGIIRQSNTFDERVEIVVKELELAIQWNRPSALLVVYNSEFVRADAETALENYLIEQGQKIVRIQMDETPELNLVSFLQDFPVTASHIFFIDGLNVGQKDAFKKLGHHKDVLINKNIRMIFWVTPKTLSELTSIAPDFWEFRQRVIEFADTPNPEHILQTAVESAWLGTGEYTDQFEDTEEKISLREAFLTELPENAESTSTRANLMLTLGILNWRKGDLEKANELLENAIKAAIRLEDNWFEAECYNAMALVKFSQGKNDEAINAYKQAIETAPEQIFVWNNLGNLCMKIMRNDEAMLAFQKALQHNPKDAIAWNGLGTVYFRIGYIDDSIGAFRKAIEIAPTLAASWVGLGDSYATIGRDIDAIASFQKAIELNKHYVTPWLKLADIYCRQSRNKDAIKTYQRALLVDPKNHQIWNELGSVLLKTNAYEEAAQAFSKASELDRSFGWAYSNLALAHAGMGKYQEAIEESRKSLDLFTDDDDKSIALDRLANFYRAVNDYDNALQAFQMADKLNKRIITGRQTASVASEPAPAQLAESAPEVFTATTEIKNTQTTPEEIPQEKQSMPAWILQPEVWDQTNTTSTTYSESLFWKEEPNKQPTEEPPMKTNEVLHTILEPISVPGVLEGQFPTDLMENEEEMAETKNPEVWNKKGNIHFQNGDYDNAISAYNKAIELDRTFGWPYSNLALTYLTMGKLPEAILLYQKSASLLENKEEQAASWNSLGNIYRHLNDYENALNAYQKADELDPQNTGKRDRADMSISGPNSHNAQVWLELGNLFFKSASYADAAEAYANAVKMDPASGWAHSNMAMSLVFQGRYKEAIPVYMKSIELFTTDKEKATSWNRLGNVYRKLNDQSNAQKAYQTAVILSNEKTSLLTRARFTLLGNCVAS
ncbi:MAG: tetratricopeptide repeat protein [Anaerolineales bacterium]|nr:tetratricopeptide repeat protein [Anaerolineales bacterium]